MITRKLKNIVENQMFKGKAIVIVGPRQVGKTTLLKELVSRSDKRVLSLNCDEPETQASLTNTNVNRLKNLIGRHELIVIDEAQKVDNIGLTIKLIVDNIEGVQVIATGSSAFELHNRLNEPLTGRKFEYMMYPVSVGEIMDTSGLMEERRTLESRLVYGSYPDILMHPEDARSYLTDLTQSYLYKDILSLNDLRKPQLLDHLLQALAFQVGSEVSTNELARTLQTDNKTIDKYIDMLEKCYVIFRIGGLSRNLRTELKKAKKIYFYDNGVRNAVIQQFSPVQMRNDMGALWENFFMAERMKHNHYRGYYCNRFFWRTTLQQEIDYIEERDGSMTAFEMKWNPKKGRTTFPKSFLEAYPVKETVVVTPENYLDWLV
ncbi:MAG: ATP-binding protein [Bacteroidales bacterium]|jgi:predicted AAA+ superfamily ATPase|nr:ATP-binding protein [Bacteroidales bacterium]